LSPFFGEVFLLYLVAVLGKNNGKGDSYFLGYNTVSFTFSVKQAEKNDPEDESAMILQNFWNFLHSDTA
jgi:hypothetical protein